MNKRKIIVCSNSAWNLMNFRGGLIRELVLQGHDVLAVAPADDYAEQVNDLGCRFVDLKMDSNGINPLKDLLLLLHLIKIIWRERPDYFLGFTAKPNIYGSFAANLFNVRVLNNIAGLGSVFVQKSWLTNIVIMLYRLALTRSSKVFFQNMEDLSYFTEHKIVPPHTAERIPGSGVDTRKFKPQEFTNRGDRGIRFLFIGRLLWEKGIGEYVEAARLLGKKYPMVEFGVLGFLGSKNSGAISSEQLNNWANEGLIRYYGSSNDVRPHLLAADCVVLPSYYREGVPRTLLEAASMGKPIITSDNVGCRDVVTHGINGFLCHARNAADLTEKIEQFIQLPEDLAIEMGKKGREKVILNFDERIVIDRYTDFINSK
ncbi:MAG: glycosyltransferase family 4 protein [Acidobacteriota bacterium]